MVPHGLTPSPLPALMTITLMIQYEVQAICSIPVKCEMRRWTTYQRRLIVHLCVEFESEPRLRLMCNASFVIPVYTNVGTMEHTIQPVEMNKGMLFTRILGYWIIESKPDIYMTFQVFLSTEIYMLIVFNLIFCLLYLMIKHCLLIKHVIHVYGTVNGFSAPCSIKRDLSPSLRPSPYRWREWIIAPLINCFTDQDKEQGNCPKWRTYLADFSQNTTMHGVRYLYGSTISRRYGFKPPLFIAAEWTTVFTNNNTGHTSPATLQNLNDWNFKYSGISDEDISMFVLHTGNAYKSRGSNRRGESGGLVW